jgi:hypothetical protein
LAQVLDVPEPFESTVMDANFSYGAKALTVGLRQNSSW